ncbi:nuclear transport factor 2 family protein [Vibrio hangzhouensis]|uniref:nuclear transport factor 2 family protein n=1 Tax=Vibrio hangzhouensis TaxID=462991 RepID=UPI001C93FDB9|nr:nuclear transport factor 2 family protein [Vibrio hangzhouensis]MBY6196288.1 nuclear transport factor 2 family protein [Vibrio hangzhouensis]
MNAKETVINYWKTMAKNDFCEASKCLAENAEVLWPQSNEKIVGRENFAAVNTKYPANGPWQFDVVSIVAEGDTVVTEVDITDGEVKAKAVTFHTVVDGLIAKQVEYWPDEYPAPEWRKQWVCAIH